MERTPAACITSGDFRASLLRDRDALIDSNLKLIPPIARRVKKRLPPSFELDDLISEGTVGLINAASRYRPQLHGGTPFSAFARPRIHGAMVDSVRRRAWLENTANPLEDAPEPAHAPVLPFLITGARDTTSRRGARTAFHSSRLPKRLAAALRRLPARQRAILGAFYGEERSISEIAELLGLSVAQVGAEHGAALDRLHAAFLHNLSILGSAYYFATRVSQERAA